MRKVRDKLPQDFKKSMRGSTVVFKNIFFKKFPNFIKRCFRYFKRLKKIKKYKKKYKKFKKNKKKLKNFFLKIFFKIFLNLYNYLKHVFQIYEIFFDKKTILTHEPPTYTIFQKNLRLTYTHRQTFF